MTAPIKSEPVPSRRQLLRAAGGTSLGLLVSGAAPLPRADERIGGPPFDALADLMRADALDARSFGAKFDNASDDAPALQRAIDAAHEQRRPLMLPGGIAILGRPLSIVGRDVSVIGAGMTATILRAGRDMPTLIDAQEPSDRIVSPFSLMRMTLHGAGVAERNLAARFRHHSFLFEVNSVSAKTGFWERDCWLARRYNCRSGNNVVGWHLVGSNHSSLWEACTITACDDVHLRLGNEGSAPDGNSALLFRGCDVEFGKGVGIDAAVAVNATFEGCYLGEGIGGDVLRNRGFVVVRGGTFFFGGGGGVGIRPLAGKALLNQVSINAQAGGIANLINLSPAEAAATGGHGQVGITEANANLPVGGLPLLQGDPLSRVPLTTFAPRLGRNWQAWSQAATTRDERSSGDLPDGRLVTCIAAKGGAGRIGLRAPLSVSRWREAAPVYFACVYRASAPVEFALQSAQGNTTHPILTLPASPARATAINVTTFLPADGFATIQGSMPATAGAFFGLQELTLADGSTIRTSAGNLKTLALAE